MKQTKKTRNPSNGLAKDKTNNWKKKAIARRLKNERQDKRIKELTQSRNRWKEKYQEQKKMTAGCGILVGEKAKYHQYSLALTSLVIELYKYGGMSLRSCQHSLSCLFVCLGLESRVPSHGSIRNWICKCGIYRVNLRPKSREDQVIFVDESITFGSDKMLLILGVAHAQISKDKSLTHADVSVLYVGVDKEWKAEQIKEKITQATSGRQVKYVVSDQGTNLRKAYKLLNYSHIEDCTHILANYLKRIYGSDVDFEAFRKLIGKLRRDWNLSKTKSKYMPPTMRGKMRFANIFPCVCWAKKILADWDNLSEEIQISLAFLQKHADFIQSLIEVEKIFKLVCKKLKEKGFGTVQQQEILREFSEMDAGERATIFIENCTAYLENLTKKRELLKEEHLLCSSDIIESYFGKFKTKVNPNNRSGLTEFIYAIATFGHSFSQQETKEAMQNIKCKHLKLYRSKAKVA